MPYTSDGSPYAPGEHGETSHAAATHADASREHKGRVYLKVLYTRGPLTDHEAAEALHVPLSSINSTRNAVMVYHLVKRGTVQRTSLYGHQAWTWEITDVGRAAVAAMTEAA
jgi:hypothetical protein